MENEADLEDIPDDVRERMTVHLAETLDDVMSVALADDKGQRKASRVSRVDSGPVGKKPRGRKPAEKKKPSRKAPAKK